MRLLVDLGNTIAMIGLEDSGEILKTWRLDTRSLGTEDQVFANLSMLFSASNLDIGEVKRVCLASVVPALTVVFEYYCVRYVGSELLRVAADDQIGVKWDVDYPAEIGADRIANVLGVVGHYGNNAIVVDFGTAITVDVVVDGAFRGGAILPGLEMSMKALYQRTARLPQIALSMFSGAVGRNTEENIRIGIVNGTVYALNGIIEKAISDYRSKPIVITTGGTATKVQNHMKFVDHHDPLLTLKGILEFELRNEKFEKNTTC